MKRLILASSSKYRAQQLDRLGLTFETCAHRCDEKLLKREGLNFDDLAIKLSILKAQSLAADYADALILGSDQVAELNGKLMGKPGTKEKALNQLLEMRGKSHRLLTGVALVEGQTGKVLEKALDIHTMKMREDLTREELAWYIEEDLPLDCAGSYKIESKGIGLFYSVSGKDFTAIMGLPIISVVTMLRRVGIKMMTG